MRRPQQLVAAIRAATALALLLALGAGLPVVLWRAAGWPLPASVPTWPQIKGALSGASIDDSTIVKTIAVVGWFAWLQLVLAVVVEVVAWARGGMARALPVTGPIQPFVRQLVLSVLVVAASSRPVAAPPVGMPDTALVVAVAHPADTAADQLPGDLRQPTQAAEPAPPTYVVKPRDSLWRIAETCLGDGLRWRELWELNRGVPQPDGRSLVNADLIRPGWTLRLPPDAIKVPPAPVPPEAAAPPTAASIAPPESSAGSSPPTPHPEAVTSTTVELPATSGSAPAADRDTDDGDSRTPAPAPIGVAGLAVVAAGLVATLTKLRRAQVRRRKPGFTVPLPDATAAAAENTLRSVADMAHSERIELAVRALSTIVAASGTTEIPALEAVLAGSDIEFLFDAPVEADADPFTVTADGRAWTLPGTTDTSKLDAASEDGTVLFPALVPIGRIDDRDLLVDLEASTVVTVEGPEEGTDPLMWSIVAGLATSAWCDDVRVVVLGDAMAGFHQLEGVERPDGDAGIAALARDVAATRAELSSQGWSSTRAARAAGGSWTPVIVIARTEADAKTAAGLVESSGGAGAGLVVVAAGEHDEADRRLSVDAGRSVTVDPPGLRAAMPELPDGFQDAVGDLLATAGCAESTEPVIDVRDTAEPDGVVTPVAGVVASPQAEGHLLIRTIGPVEIEGGRDIDRRQSEELVVYLGLHPDGADEQTIRTALWPESSPSQHTFNQVVSRARVCLGTDPAGEHYLPRLNGGAYRLSDYVTTDGELLGTAFAAAQRTSGPEAIEGLAAALRLVRGQPFQAVKAGYEWAHSEGFATRLEILAADAAHHLASWYLDQGETTPALWAAEQGLLASPLDEALFRDRMRAYAAAGNHAAVEAVMRELCRAVDALEPYDSLHPETVDLYNQLTRRRVG